MIPLLLLGASTLLFATVVAGAVAPNAAAGVAPTYTVSGAGSSMVNGVYSKQPNKQSCVHHSLPPPHSPFHLSLLLLLSPYLRISLLSFYMNVALLATAKRRHPARTHTCIHPAHAATFRRQAGNCSCTRRSGTLERSTLGRCFTKVRAALLQWTGACRSSGRRAVGRELRQSCLCQPLLHRMARQCKKTVRARVATGVTFCQG